MKLFKNLLGSVKPHFEKGGKLEKLYPAYDAFETFLFVPDHTTHKGTHVRDAIDLKRKNWRKKTLDLNKKPSVFLIHKY